MRRTITICLLVGILLTLLPPPEASAIDPVTMAILAPIAMKAAEKTAPYVGRALYNLGKGFLRIGKDIFHFFYLPYGLGYMCFGNVKRGLVYVIKGGIAPGKLIVHTLMLPVLLFGVDINF